MLGQQYTFFHGLAEKKKKVHVKNDDENTKSTNVNVAEIVWMCASLCVMQ